MKNVYQSYQEKLRTPDEAVQIIKSGDWIDYTTNLGFPALLDEALARRRDELYDVKIRGNLMFGPLKTVAFLVKILIFFFIPSDSSSGFTPPQLNILELT